MKENKKAKKVVALLLCAVLLVVGSVTGTMAYLTANDTVTNTFTVGKVAKVLFVNAQFELILIIFLIKTPIK